MKRLLREMKRQLRKLAEFSTDYDWPQVAIMTIALVAPAVLSSDGHEATNRLVKLLRWVCGVLLAAAVLMLATRLPFDQLTVPILKP